MVDANPESRPWKQEIAKTARVEWDAYHRETAYPPLASPLEVTFTFYRARPKSHYRSGKHSDTLRDLAPAYPITRPDALKLARAAEDALTGVVWADDAQIVTEHLEKRYGLPERVEIVVRELEAVERREAA